MKKLIVILLCSCGQDYAAMYYPDASSPDVGYETDAGELPWCCNVYCYGTDPMPCERSWMDVCAGSPNWYCAHRCERDATGMPTGRGNEQCSPSGGIVDTGPFNCRCRKDF